jgi:hypothetical protein
MTKPGKKVATPLPPALQERLQRQRERRDGSSPGPAAKIKPSAQGNRRGASRERRG